MKIHTFEVAIETEFDKEQEIYRKVAEVHLCGIVLHRCDVTNLVGHGNGSDEATNTAMQEFALKLVDLLS
jgi:hypothetical protein